jgi:hypothetical protein
MKPYVSFSKVTVAVLGASGSPELGVTEREVILPLADTEGVSAFNAARNSNYATCMRNQAGQHTKN